MARCKACALIYEGPLCPRRKKEEYPHDEEFVSLVTVPIPYSAEDHKKSIARLILARRAGLEPATSLKPVFAGGHSGR